MIVKLEEETQHTWNMQLNLDKCTFGVRMRKFMGFHLKESGIEANQDKCQVCILLT